MKFWSKYLTGTLKPMRRKGPRLFERRDKKIGQPPGTPIHIGPPRDFVPWVSLVQYDQEICVETAKIEPKELPSSLKPQAVNWINVEGVHDIALVQNVASLFDVHPLTVEDLVNSSLRPQFESYPGYWFFSLQMLYLNGDKQLMSEHVSLILKNNSVLSFQETPGDVFGRIRERIKGQTAKMYARGADHLVYMLLDSIVDGYYQVVDRLGERFDALEDELRGGPRDHHLGQVYDIRREILFLRKNIFPVRDLLNKVQVDGRVFQENTKIYLKDLNDHVTQVIESLNLSMEMSAVLIETYHSMQNSRMNAIMKTLTMISTIFLPLNFIAGVYGMNFQHMPELAWRWSYPIVLGTMFVVGFGMVLFFIKKGWLLEGRARNLWSTIFFADDPVSSERKR